MFGEATYLGNSGRSWLTALLISTAVLLALWVMVHFVLQRLSSFARTTETDIDDVIAYVGATTKLGLLVVPALYVGSYVLSLPAEVSTWFRVLAWTALLIQAAIWGDATISFWLKDFREEHGDEVDRVTTVGAVSFVFRLLLYAIVLVLVLDNIPGVEVTALVGSLGIGGIAVALAVQSILGDLFASLSIALDKPFVLGDFVEVGDEGGTVEYIGLKTTRLRRLSGEELVVGNNDLLNSRIRNFGRMGERRVVFAIGVATETPPETLERIPDMMREIIEALPKVRFARAHFIRLSGFSFEYEVVYYVLDPDYDLYMDTQQTINLSIVRRFAAQGIEIPYPTQTVRLAYQEPADRTDFPHRSPDDHTV
jgi:small-conductance mechanosensitive channel